MKSCVTISLVKEAKGGPFVYWNGLSEGCRHAAELGFDAVEVFPPGPEAVDVAAFTLILEEYGLQLAAVGTGAGWVKHQLTLTDPAPDRRAAAIQYVESIIHLAGQFKASAIIGSMQGRVQPPLDQQSALAYVRQALDQLGPIAAHYDVPLIFEPLNRYETNVCNTLAAGEEILAGLFTDNVVLLADLFHMNIEEADLGAGAAACRYSHRPRPLCRLKPPGSRGRTFGCCECHGGFARDRLSRIPFRRSVTVTQFPNRGRDDDPRVPTLDVHFRLNSGKDILGP